MPIKNMRNINKKPDLINRIGIGDELEKVLEGGCGICG
jgi:hypothetical protein